MAWLSAFLSIYPFVFDLWLNQLKIMQINLGLYCFFTAKQTEQNQIKKKHEKHKPFFFQFFFSFFLKNFLLCYHLILFHFLFFFSLFVTSKTKHSNKRKEKKTFCHRINKEREKNYSPHIV